MNLIENSEDLPVKWTEALSKITGLTFLLCKEDKYYAYQEGENLLCRLLQENAAGRLFCEQDCTTPLVRAITRGIPVYFKCYAHLNNVVIPVYPTKVADRKYLILGGRSLTSYDDLVAYRGIAEKLGCDQGRVFDTVKNVSFKSITDFKSVIEAIKAATAYLFHNAERYKDIEDKINKLKTIIKVASSTGDITDNIELYTTILSTLGVLFNVKAAILFLRDEIDEDRFTMKEVFGYKKEDLTKVEITWIHDLIENVVARNNVVPSSDLFYLSKTASPDGIRSVSMFPISIKKRLEGFITVLNTPISPDDEELINSFCMSISLLLENRLLISSRGPTAEKGFAVLQALHSIAPYIDSPEIFNIIIDRAADLVGAEQGSLMLLSEGSHALEVKATKGLNPAILNHVRINPGEGIAGTVLERGTPLLVVNLEKDSRVLRPNRVRYKTKSFVSLPLKVKDKSIGVLNLSDKASGTDFSGDDLKFLEGLALCATVAIERRMYYQSSVNLREISITDPLTELLNRRYFEERIAEEMERSNRHGQPFSLIIMDIDNFKDFNDTYGHLAGDEALKITGHVIRRCIRIIDIAARYGGEEFAIILPTTDKEDARIIGNRIRDGIERSVFNIKVSGKKARLSVSLGIASYPTDAGTSEELINNADKAMYKAKSLGKNRVELFGNF